MKHLNLLLFSLIILFSACSKDDPTDFLGSYNGPINCTSASGDTFGGTSDVVVTQNSDDSFTVTIDDVSFLATANDDTLTIAQQSIPGEAGTFGANMVENEDGTFTLTATLNVDGETANCTSILTKQ